MAGKQIVRIENSDSDLRFRDKVNRNFSSLQQTTAVERAAYSPSAIEDIIETLESKADVDHTHAGGPTIGGIATVTPISIAPGAEYSGSVTFPEAFDSTPAVVLTTDGWEKSAYLVSTSATGFSYKVMNKSDSANMTAITLHWMAVS